MKDSTNLVPDVPVNTEDAINETPVHLPEEINETPAGAVVPQNDDPVFKALQKEKKRNKRLRRLLTENKNRSTVSTDSTAPGVGEGEELPEEKGPLAAPILQTGDSAAVKKQDPITGFFDFIGRGRKKRDGP